ncbi:hypothetical protein GSI_09555 [Ganoderma sinense ZZ0214-1]|uniref:Uncharacterized protein n=1 Tax=Ganoderma sinense ZZ0214-1 TaxID=1077348 RepID=A0A2G8RYQ1_9APHY|nr:hypothetical protein GSI_11260 [Ganoderma sinense ZZ0214-1]PIL28404.1 hypothetical protein GSI_09555 [Ganoderma sinense ZZ0214-1]
MPGFRAVGDTIGPTYKRLAFAQRGYLRLSANTALSEVSGVSGSKMRWELLEYVLYVYLKLRVQLVGWPGDLVFTNLSNPPLTGLGCISRLVALWDSGAMHFAPVTDAEYRAALEDPYSCAPGPLHRGFPENLGRCDIKKRKYRPKTDPLGLRVGRYIRNGPKSARVVSETAADGAEGE